MADLTDGEIAAILTRAADFATAAEPRRRPFTVALLFLTPSLRSRFGFSVATARLGGTSHLVTALRLTETMSEGESFHDTVRVMAGMSDLVITRTPFRLDPALVNQASTVPLINGGDDDNEHPTQALLDLAMIRRLYGTEAGLRIGICGDLRTRSAHSLARLLARSPLVELRLLAPPSRSWNEDTVPVGATSFDRPHFAGLDVLYMTGLPERRGQDVLGPADRQAFALTAERLAALPPHAAVLSPGPTIDEIDATARRDPRIRMFEQSDYSLFVRMALIEMLLGRE